MYELGGNLRYAIRQFRQAPVFTATAILTLALGIGGTTAIFSLIHAVMLRSLPVSDPGMLYRVGEGNECLRGRRHAGYLGDVLGFPVLIVRGFLVGPAGADRSHGGADPPANRAASISPIDALRIE